MDLGRRIRVAVALLCLGAQTAFAAGITTHAFMAERAIPYVRSDELKAILGAHLDAVLSGGAFPDSGYYTRDAGVPGGDYGEISHWERFINAYAAHIRNKAECAPLTAADGPCAKMIAHLMGAAAHGMGDETWDWMFEPLVRDHGEQKTIHPVYETANEYPVLKNADSVPPGSLIDSIEYAMDTIAIVDHDRWIDVPLYVPPFDELVQVYAAIGRSDVTADGLRAGHAVITSAIAAERLGAAVDGERVRQQMPWSSAHFYAESGGVVDSAQAIAGYLDSVWRKVVTGAHPGPQIVAIHPEHGETGVPTQWQPAKTSPGPGSGGGELRILAVFSNSVDPDTVNAQSFGLFDANGDPVTPRSGFPRPGPYGADDGTHSLLFYPSTDLAPCHRYTAKVTTALQDHAGSSLFEDFSWSFTTRAVSGGPCS